MYSQVKMFLQVESYPLATFLYLIALNLQQHSKWRIAEQLQSAEEMNRYGSPSYPRSYSESSTWKTYKKFFFAV